MVIAIECSLIHFYKNGLISFSSEFSIRTYLVEYGGRQFWLATHIHYFFKDIFYFLALMTIVWVASEFHKPYFWSSTPKNRIGLSLAIINLLSFGALLGVLMWINDPRLLIAYPHSLTSLIYITSPVLWLFFIGSLVTALFPLKRLSEWALKNRALTVFIFVASALTVHQEWIEVIVNFWSDLLLQSTLGIALQITRLMGLDVHLIPNGEGVPIFGTSRFEVEIWPACSGYEGMALMIALLAIHCFLQRNKLRTFRVLWIIPLASMAMFSLNGIRIAILIAIGDFFSPQLALDGFHVVGGWLNLLLVLILSLFVLNMPFFQKEAKSKTSFELGDTALLLPLISLIVIGLMTKAINPNFAWLYSVHIGIAAFVLYLFRKPFLLFFTRPSILSIAIGVAVFILWIILVPDNPSQSAHFIAELNTAPLWLSTAWLLFRVLGATVIVPIAEEFAFRGYLQPHLQYWFDEKGFKSVSVITSLGITSLLFGYVHSDILAGSVAGLFFGLAYLQRRQLIDAVIAHAVTNALLALYVMYLGYWSYW